MTFDELAKLEPRLRALERTALSAHRPGRADWSQWERIKAALGRLVGWRAPGADSRLTTTLAWDVAYAHLLACWETGRRPSSSPEPWPPAEEHWICQAST